MNGATVDEILTLVNRAGGEWGRVSKWTRARRDSGRVSDSSGGEQRLERMHVTLGDLSYLYLELGPDCR